MDRQLDHETATLLGWGWRNVPGLVIAYVVTGQPSMLNAIRKARDGG